MAESKNVKSARENYDLWKRYSDARQPWYRDHVDENIRFYFGQQWTEEEREQLKERGQADIVVNRTRAIIRFLVAMLTANRPSFRASPVTGGDRGVADIFNELFSYVWRISNGYKQFERATFSFTRAGIGWFFVYYDPRADYGQGEVKFRQVNPKHIYIDASAGEEPDLSDAEAMIISKRISIKKAQQLYPSKSKQLRNAIMSEEDFRSTMESEQEIDYVDESADKDIGLLGEQVRIIETYRKKYRQYWATINPETQELQINETKPKEEDSATVEVAYIEREITAGYDVFISRDILPPPISEYPLIPMIYEDTENPYPLGEIEFLKGPQRFLNKSMSVTILSAQVGSTPKIILWEGSVDDEEEFKTNYAAPGSVSVVRDTGHGPPITVSPLPLNNAFFSIAQEMKHDMEYESGAFSPLQGDPTNAPDTAKATLALQEYGVSKSKLSLRAMESTMTRLGQSVMQFIQAYWRQPKVIRLITDKTDEMDQVAVNQPQLDDRGNEIGKLFDLSVGRYDISISTGSTLPTNRMLMAGLHLELVEKMGIPVKYALEYLDLPKTEQIIKDTDKMAQLQQQNQQLKGMMEQATQEISELETKVQTSDRAVRDAQYSANWSKALNQFRAELEIERAKSRENLRAEINDLTTDLNSQIGDTLSSFKESFTKASNKEKK